MRISRYWRDCAEETRVRAETCISPENRRFLEGIAEFQDRQEKRCLESERISDERTQHMAAVRKWRGL